MGWTPSHPAFDRNPLDLADEAAAAGRPVTDYVVGELTAGRLRFAGEDPDDPAQLPAGDDDLAGQPARLLRQGHGVLHAAPARRRGRGARRRSRPSALRPAEVTLAGGGAARQARPGHHDRLPDDEHLHLLRHRAARGDLVREARHLHHRHAPVRALVQPGDRPAVGDPHRLRRVRGSSPSSSPGWPPTHLGTRTDVLAAPLLHDIARRAGPARRRGAGLEARRVRPGPGRDDAAAGRRSSGTTPRWRRRWPRSARWSRRSAPASRASPGSRPQRSTTCAGRTGGYAAASADGRPSLARDVHLAEAILALSGTTNGQVAVQGWRALEQRTGVQLADLAEERAGERISFADTQVQPRAVITSPEWSGSETGGRRYSPFVVNVERKKPWHTLTGRMHFFLDHDWIAEYGECAADLPAAAGLRPALRRAGAARAGPPGDHRPLPDPALEVVDPLGVPGQPAHAAAVPRRPGDLDEPGRRGQDRRRRQRLDRGVQPQRRRGLPGRGHPPDARGHGVHVPREGPAPDDAEVGGLRLARRRRQLADPAGRSSRRT